MTTILFVCTGNVCRSPMAEGLFRAMTQGQGQYRVLSAGTGALDGQPPSPLAVRALAELGIDISLQRSRSLSAELVKQADYILGLTQGHVDTVLLLYPQATERTLLLREFDDTLEGFEKDILDPIGEGLETYRECRDKIEQGLHSLLKFITNTAPGTAAPRKTMKPLTLAVGADHAGFELKEALKQHLERQGRTVHDLGAHSAEPTDYPDYAQAVAARVVSREVDFGVLVCASGVGMSIAANKVPGIRAAVARDEQMATLVRQHNDANILCLGTGLKPEALREIITAYLTASFEGGRHQRRVDKISALEGLAPGAGTACPRP